MSIKEQIISVVVNTKNAEGFLAIYDKFKLQAFQFVKTFCNYNTIFPFSPIGFDVNGINIDWNKQLSKQSLPDILIFSLLSSVMSSGY